MTLAQPLHPPHSLGVHTTLSALPAADCPQALAKAATTAIAAEIAGLQKSIGIIKAAVGPKAARA